MINKNKQILRHCPNFYKIIEFKPIEGDEITKSIIKMYKEYIFKVDININENIIEIGKLDEAVSKYIDDYIFRKELKKGLQELKVKKREIEKRQLLLLKIAFSGEEGEDYE